MISSLVIHLDLDEGLANEAIVSIAAEQCIEIGARHESRLPIVLECATPTRSQEITDWLIELPGVTHIDVTFVHLDPPAEYCQKGQAS